MNNHFVLSTRDAADWRAYLARLDEPSRDVYFYPEYYALYERPQTQAECFIFEDEERFILYPYLRTALRKAVKFPLEEDWYDIEGAYGYNGMLSNTADPAFFAAFAATFAGYCKDQGIVAEFTRFHPLLRNHLPASSFMEVIDANTNVVVDLAPSAEELWMGSYEHSTRKNVNKAEKNGLTVEWRGGADMDDARMKAFLDIYYATMDRNEAEDFYYFDENYFRHVCIDLGDRSLFFFTMKDGKAVSCELVLFSGPNAYSFLGGTLTEYYPYRPNDILKHRIILTLKELGVSRFLLGGGVQRGDGIYRYKKTFAKNGDREFYIGRKIHDYTAYLRLCAAWEERFPEKAARFKNFTLKYRQ